MAHHGFLSLLPVLFLLGYVLFTRRAVEGLLFASVLGLVLLGPADFFDRFVSLAQQVLMSDKMAWIILLCALIGALVSVMERSGGAEAFGQWILSRVRSTRGVLLWTWFLSTLLFIDDFLIVLTVGSCMSHASDKHGIPREMLGYVVSSSASPVAAIAPLSTWAVFTAALLEKYLDLPPGEGILYFLKIIPFNFYAWFAFLLVPLVICGVVPAVGPLGKAWKRARETGVLAPPGSEKMSIRAESAPNGSSGEGTRSVADFFIPIAALVGATIWFDLDLIKGGFVALAVACLLYVPRRIMSMETFVDASIDGIKGLIVPLLLTAEAFLFNEVNGQLGLVPFLLETASPFLSPHLFPAVIFLVFGLISFSIGASWSLYVVAMPIVLPLATAVGANQVLAMASLMAAGTVGAHCCFYSDQTLLTASACGCHNYNLVLAQLPFAAIAAIGSLASFSLCGFIF